MLSKRGLIKGVIILCFVVLIVTIGYYFIYYMPNKNELIKMSTEFVEQRLCLDAIPEEIREEEFESEKVQEFIDEVRAELAKCYSKNGDYLEREVEYLSEFYESQFLEGEDMVIDMETDVYQIDIVKFSTKNATVKVKVKIREVTEIYGPYTVRSLYTVEYVKENGEWRVVSNELEPV